MHTVCACRQVKLVIELFSTVWSTNCKERGDYIFHCFGESNEGGSITEITKTMMRKTVITELMKIGNKK